MKKLFSALLLSSVILAPLGFSNSAVKAATANTHTVYSSQQHSMTAKKKKKTKPKKAHATAYNSNVVTNK